MNNGKDNDRERLFEMTDSPEQFSDEELNGALQSDGSDGDLNRLSTLKRAMAMNRADLSEDDINRQWETFKATHSDMSDGEQPRIRRSWLKVAAMFTGAIMIAGIAFAAISIVKDRHQDKSEETESVLNTADSQTDMADMSMAQSDTTITKTAEAPVTVQFDDVELGNIMNDIAAYYNIKLKYENEQTRHIKMFFKWNKQADIAAIVEILNSYDRISMELDGNTLTIK